MKKLFYFTLLASIIFASCQTTDNKPVKNEPRFEAFVSAEKADDDAETRAEMIDGIYHWSVGDVVGLFITEAGNTQKIVNNLAMTGLHEEPATETHFKGELLFDEISLLDPNGSYDYYTYFPHHSEGANFSLPYMEFDIPSSISVEKNVFPAHYAPMVGTSHKGMHPMTWLEEEEQQWGERLSFHYKHTLSYLKLQLECNLMSQSVTSVRVSAPSGTNLSGALQINLETGAASYVSGSNQLTINISGGGLNVGDAIYIPMPVGDYSQTDLTFTFTFENGTTWAKTGKGGILQRGQSHAIRFKLPFIVHFDATPKLGYNNSKLPSFIYKGWSFGGNGNYRLFDDYIEFPGQGGSSVNQNGTATLTTPILDLTTMSGRTTIPVRLNVYMNGGGAVLASNRRLYYGAVSSTFNDIMSGYPYIQIDGEMSASRISLRASMDWTANYNGWLTFDLTPAAPRVGLNHVTTSTYNGWIMRIEVYPNY